MHDAFRINDWVIQPSLNRMWRNGEAVQVEPRMMGVLCSLAAQPGEVVTRAALMEQVWVDTYVGEETLTRSVSELRKIFGDDPRQPRVIETIYKTGYRLIAPVQPLAKDISAVDQEIAIENRLLTTLQGHLKPTSWTYRWLWLFLPACVAMLVLVLYWITAHRISVQASLVPRTQPLTSLPGEEIFPALAPDGNRVAFSWRGPDQATFNLYVKQVGTETMVPLTQTEDHDVLPAWSPEGTQVAFARFSSTGCNIMVLPALGGPARRLAPCGGGGVRDLTWSPDGAWLALSGRENPHRPFRIYLLAPETGSTRALTTPPAGFSGDELAAFSPDGKDLAFVRTNIFGISDLYITPVRNGTPRRLTSDNLKIRGIAWAKDGRQIFFSSNRNGADQVWRIAREGGTPELVSGAHDAFDLSYAADTKRLVFEQRTVDTNIWRIPHPKHKAAEAAVPLIASTRWDSYPQYAPDGTRIAFTSNRTGTPEVWLADADGSNVMQLTSTGDPFVSRPRWSPDATHIVFNSRAAGNADVYVVDVAEARPRRLTFHAAIDAGASWSLDGQWIFFTSNRSGTWQIWKVPAAGGTPQQLTQDGGYVAHAAQDKRHLYVTQKEEGGLWVVPLEGGNARKVFDTPEPLLESQWTVTIEGIYFIQAHEQASPMLTLYDPASGLRYTYPAPFTLSREEYKYAGFSLSPDGAWMLYTQVDRRESDLLLIEPLL